jgi:hypothetical protein
MNDKSKNLITEQEQFLKEWKASQKQFKKFAETFGMALNLPNDNLKADLEKLKTALEERELILAEWMVTNKAFKEIATKYSDSTNNTEIDSKVKKNSFR